MCFTRLSYLNIGSECTSVLHRNNLLNKFQFPSVTMTLRFLFLAVGEEAFRWSTLGIDVCLGCSEETADNLLRALAGEAIRSP